MKADQLAAVLRRRLPSHLPGTRLPGARELSRQFEVSEYIARKALELLADEGLLVAQKRGGHFVSKRGGQAASLREAVAVIHPVHSQNMHVQSVLAGIDEDCHRQGLRLSLDTTAFESDPPGPIQRQRLDELVGRPGVGLLAVSCVPPHQLLHQWLRLALPLVLVDVVPPSGLLINCVSSDHEGAAFSATERLIQLGHRRIAYLGPVMEDAPLLKDRYRGHQMAHFTSGMRPDPALLWSGEECEQSPAGHRRLDELLGQGLVTAVLAGNQRIGVAALASCERLGLAVPDDLSVMAIGVVRRELGAAADKLSRFDQGRPEDLGLQGVELLVDFDAQRRPTHLFQRAEWIDGGSAGPPRG